ncbi:MAG: ABC transporter permease subunit [Puniceicoccaceae bacterium]
MALIQRNPDPERFTVGRKTLLLDRFMTHFIKMGGIGIIAAVFGIFIFILLQILPLFQGADVREEATLDTGRSDGVLVGMDEWGELPFILTEEGTVEFHPLEIDPETREPVVEGGKYRLAESGVREFRPEFSPAVEEWTAFDYDTKTQTMAFGSADGRIGLIDITYQPEFTETSRTIRADVSSEGPFAAGGGSGKIIQIDFFGDDSRRLVGTVQESPDGGGANTASFVAFAAKRGLFGGGELKRTGDFVITEGLTGNPVRTLVGGRGDRIFVVQDNGEVVYYTYRDGELGLVQTFRPFGGKEAVVSTEWMLGRISLSFVSSRGENEIWSSYLDEEKGHIVYARIKELPHFPGRLVNQDHSLRNRAFLIAGENEASLRYMTTGAIRWAGRLDFDAVAGFLGPKYDAMVFYDREGILHFLSLDDPHPEAGFAAFFKKIWYEGQSGPSYSWQSTGGSSSFEPKLSVVPLVFGSIKGTLYAMLFAVPISVLAAVYCSQFLRPEFKRFVKPTMEIMASLPSVVLGFLAALWLAPMWKDRVPSILCVIVLIPAGTILFGLLWGKLPQSIRLMVKPGWEFLVMMPAVVFFGWLAWQVGPVIEGIFFTVTDPATGLPVGDFGRWWPEFTGADYEQRNSLVVGFVMGFTVIPLIFTISEDAMSNVPPYLTSASLALGASRWQTAARIVLPTASPGIFSAFMIGLGRAVGETMIVVMATGNTPVMDWNIFNGMRTLAANIAVELPEAAKDGTLYRTLFLGAMLLFIMTFAVNTVAEIVRQRLRERYKDV